MKQIFTSQDVPVIDGVAAVTTKARIVTMKGKHGTVTKDFRHLPIEVRHVKATNSLKVVMWFGTKKQISCVRTVCSHLENMMKGVTQGFCYKMRLVYAHFPINSVVMDTKDSLEIRNFLGDKKVRKVQLHEGVRIEKTKDVKDELVLRGADIDAVAQSAALIRQSVLVRKKDIRKFLDGIYVSEKTTIDIPVEA